MRGFLGVGIFKPLPAKYMFSVGYFISLKLYNGINKGGLWQTTKITTKF